MNSTACEQTATQSIADQPPFFRKAKPPPASALITALLIALSAEPSQVKVATISPKQEGFLRELTQQPGLKLLPLQRYREADVLLNPPPIPDSDKASKVQASLPATANSAREETRPKSFSLNELQQYLREGGRILFYGKQPPAEISPFQESEPAGGGVAWVNPHAGEFAEIDWSGHLGGSSWQKVKERTNVLAVLESGAPHFLYHAVENGAVAYLGKKSGIWFHDEMLALAIQYFARCPLEFSIGISVVQEPLVSVGMESKISIQSRAAKKQQAESWLEFVPLVYDPFIGKEIEWPAPSRCRLHLKSGTKVDLHPRGEQSYSSTVSGWKLPAGKCLVVATLLPCDAEHLLREEKPLLASSARIVHIKGRADLKVSAHRRVVRQNHPIHFKVETQPGQKRVDYAVLDPFDQEILEGQTALDGDGTAQISVHCAKWVPGRYRLQVVLSDDRNQPLNRQWFLWHVAPDSPFEPPHWLGRWDVYFRKRGWRELMYNYRELGITFASWTDWGSWWPKPGEWEEADEILDWAAAAGFKINFWGINDKSAPPSKLLAHFGIEETDDFHCLSENGKREGGKCLTEPLMTQAFTKYFDELSRSGLLSHPAFGFFTMSDEGGRFLKCWCDRCLGEYANWMRSRGATLEQLGAGTWREAYASRTRTNMQFLCGKMRGWYKTMIDPLHEHTPQLLTTTNHGGMAFTFGRYQYPWIVDDIFQVMEADSYPWWTIEDTDCIMDRTAFTTAILRSAGLFQRPVNLIVNAQEVHGDKEVKRPPRILPNDLLEQIYAAVLEGCRTVEFYAETFHHRWHVSFKEWQKYTGLAEMPDERYAEYLQRPVSEMQSAIREASSTLDLLDPILRVMSRRAEIAIVKPIVDEVWFPRWMKPFKEASGGSPVDYLGEGLKTIEQYGTVLLPENIARAGLPHESWKKLRRWVQQGGVLIASQLSGKEAIELFGAEVKGEPANQRANIELSGEFGKGLLELPPRANARSINPLAAEVVALYADGGAAITTKKLGAGRTYLIGFDLAESREAAHLLLKIMAANLRPPLVQSDQPHVDLSVKETDGTLYILTLYYREPVTWTPRTDTFYPDPLKTRISLNLNGEFDAYDVLASEKIPLTPDRGRQILNVSLPLSRLRAYAIVPRAGDAITISIPRVCKRGMKVPYRVNSAATKLVHIEFINTRGDVDSRSSHFALTNRQQILDSCDNDLIGKWTIRITDVQTAKCTQETFDITAQFAPPRENKKALLPARGVYNAVQDKLGIVT